GARGDHRGAGGAGPARDRPGGRCALVEPALERRHPPLEGAQTSEVSTASGHDRLGEAVETPGEPVDAIVQLGEVPVDAVVLRGDDTNEARQHVDGLVEPRVGLVEPRVGLIEPGVRAALRLLNGRHALLEPAQALGREADDLSVSLVAHARSIAAVRDAINTREWNIYRGRAASSPDTLWTQHAA